MVTGDVMCSIEKIGIFNIFFFFFQAEDGIRDYKVTGVQTCALPIYHRRGVQVGGGGDLLPSELLRRHVVDRADQGSCDGDRLDRKSTRLNSSHLVISYAVFCLKKKKLIMGASANFPLVCGVMQNSSLVNDTRP